MKKEKILLIGLVLALDHIDLNWHHIPYNYLEYQSDKNIRTDDDLLEIRKTVA